MVNRYVGGVVPEFKPHGEVSLWDYVDAGSPVPGELGVANRQDASTTQEMFGPHPARRKRLQMSISRKVTNVINRVGSGSSVLVQQWIGLVENVGAIRIARLDGVVPGHPEARTGEETPRLAFDLTAGARVYVPLETRGAESGKNVKALGNALAGSPRAGQERNNK